MKIEVLEKDIGSAYISQHDLVNNPDKWFYIIDHPEIIARYDSFSEKLIRISTETNTVFIYHKEHYVGEYKSMRLLTGSLVIDLNPKGD